MASYLSYARGRMSDRAIITIVGADKGTCGRMQDAWKNRTVNNCGYSVRGNRYRLHFILDVARLAGKQTTLHKPPVAIQSRYYLLTFRIYRRTGVLAKLVCLELSFDARDRPCRNYCAIEIHFSTIVPNNSHEKFDLLVAIGSN